MGVQFSDALVCFVFHPASVEFHVRGQTAVALPIVQFHTFLRIRIHRGFASEYGRYLDHRLVDRDGHRVQILGIRFETQALRLKRDGTASREWVKQCGQVAAHAVADLGFCCVERLLVIGVLPFDKLFQNFEKTFAFLGLRFLGREQFRM